MDKIAFMEGYTEGIERLIMSALAKNACTEGGGAAEPRGDNKPQPENVGLVQGKMEEPKPANPEGGAPAAGKLAHELILKVLNKKAASDRLMPDVLEHMGDKYLSPEERAKWEKAHAAELKKHFAGRNPLTSRLIGAGVGGTAGALMGAPVGAITGALAAKHPVGAIGGALTGAGLGGLAGAGIGALGPERAKVKAAQDLVRGTALGDEKIRAEINKKRQRNALILNTAGGALGVGAAGGMLGSLRSPKAAIAGGLVGAGVGGTAGYLARKRRQDLVNKLVAAKPQSQA